MERLMGGFHKYQPKSEDRVKPSAWIEKRADELVGSGKRPNHLHAYLSAIIEYLDEQAEAKGSIHTEKEGQT